MEKIESLTPKVESSDDLMLRYRKELKEAVEAKEAILEENRILKEEKGSHWSINEDIIEARELKVKAVENKIALMEDIQVFEKERDALFEKGIELTTPEEIANTNHEIEIVETIIKDIYKAMKEIYVSEPFGHNPLEYFGTDPKYLSQIKENCINTRQRMAWTD